MKLLERFGGMLRSVRISRGISQEKLGQLSGIDRTHISAMERGKRNVSLETISRLAVALECGNRDLIPD